jgi:hypothetical protein
VEWDADVLSAEFLRAAERAAARMQECRSRARTSPGHKGAYDEALAEFYVYNRLHGRTFLASRDALLDELRSMKGLPVARGSSAYEEDRFERLRLAEINRLIRRFELPSN